MTEERVCKSCGRPIDYLEYKEGSGRCHQCQPGYGGHSYTEGSDIAPSDADRVKHVITQLEIKLRESIREANHEIKQRDETIKELKEALKKVLPIAEYYHNDQITYTDMPYKNWKSIIEKSRNLIELNEHGK